MKIAGIAGGACLTIAALWCSLGLAPENSSLGRASSLEATQSPDMNEVLPLYSLALREDAANPIRWADVGEILDNLGDTQRADYAFRQAGSMSAGTPQNLIRQMNHFALSGDAPSTVKTGLQVLDLTDRYDKTVFAAFDRSQSSVTEIARQLSTRPRVRTAYFDHLVAADSLIQEAGEAWQVLHDQLPPESIAAYSATLLRNKAYAAALQVWRTTHPGTEEQLLYNGSFETDLSKSPFDWELQAGTQAHIGRAEVAHEVHQNLGVLAVSVKTHEQWPGRRLRRLVHEVSTVRLRRQGVDACTDVTGRVSAHALLLDRLSGSHEKAARDR